MINIVAAMDEKRGIGKDDKIPWHITGDLVHLKNLTTGRVVILGRKTYESMASYYKKSGRPMPGKLYVVITRDPSMYDISIYDANNLIVVGSLEEALRQAQGKPGNREVFIIGGGQVFKEAMEKGLVDRLYLTIVEGDYGADTFFPNYSGFKLVREEKHDNGKYKFKFVDLVRS